MTTWYPISDIFIQYQNPSTNAPYSGAVLKAYRAGTSTVINMATDATGTTTMTSVALNASGFPAVSGNVVIPHVSEDYKLSLYPNQTAADSNTGAVVTLDNFLINSSDDGGGSVTAGDSVRNFIWNPFRIWQRGTEFDEDTFDARYGVADGWSFSRSSFTLNGKVALIKGDRLPYACRLQRAVGSSSTAAFNLCANLSFEETAELAGKEVTFGFSAKMGEDYSASDGQLFAVIRYTKFPVMQSVNLASGQYSIDDNLLDTLTCELELTLSDFEKTVIIPADATQIMMRISFTPSGSAAGDNDYVDIEEPFIIIGDTKPNTFELVPFEDVITRAQREYVKSYSYEVVAKTVTPQGAFEVTTEGLKNNLSMREYVRLPIDMLGLPSITLYNTAYDAVSSTNRTGKLKNITDVTDIPIYADNISTNSFVVKEYTPLTVKQRGTFTPVFNSVTATYTTQLGNYKIEGDWCFGDIVITCSVFNNADVSSGNITGLPVAAAVAGLGLFDINRNLSTLIDWSGSALCKPDLAGTVSVGLYDGTGTFIPYNGGRFKTSGSLYISFAYRIKADAADFAEGYKTRKYQFHYAADCRL